MRVLLLHNPTAGRGVGSDRKQLMALLRHHGHTVEYQSTKGRDWKKSLTSAHDLIVVCGGDGTVGKVLRRLRINAPPVAILPNGSANNIALSLGIDIDDWTHWVDQWPHAPLHRFARPSVRAKGFERLFVEAAGLGVFPQVIAAPAAESAGGEEKVAQGTRSFIHMLEQSQASAWRIDVDGLRIDAEAIMVEVLNVPFIGPRLNLSVGMRPGGDWLDVVCVPASLRSDLIEQIRHGSAMEQPHCPPSLHRARVVHLYPDGAPMHVDDKLWPKPLARDAHVEFVAGGAPVWLLRPA